MISVSDFMPKGWRDLLAERGPCAIGFDVATTAKKKSNPSGIALLQQVGLDNIVRLVVRFKTTDPEVSEAIIRDLCELPHGLRVRRVCVDATSEKFFAATLRKNLVGTVVVEPVVQSETMLYKGEKMTVKAYLGNLLVNTCDDGHLHLPQAKWLESDMRQVKRANGSFEADVDDQGNHADAFDAIKFGLHGLVRAGGKVEAAGSEVGGVAGAGAKPRWWKNPLAAAASAVKRWC